jgi:hypothetical protein
MKDGPCRKIIKRIALVRYSIDLAVMRLLLKLRGHPQFELKGSCEGCGTCCEAPSMQVNALIFRLKTVRRLFLTWHRLINGFEYIGEIRRDYVLIFRCGHFDPEAKLCDSYSSRPGMCRDYPRALLYQVKPEFFKECGYFAIDQNAKQFRAALYELDLTPEKLEELKKKLYLDEG